jgi:hypothetical protein
MSQAEGLHIVIIIIHKLRDNTELQNECKITHDVSSRILYIYILYIIIYLQYKYKYCNDVKIIFIIIFLKSIRSLNMWKDFIQGRTNLEGNNLFDVYDIFCFMLFIYTIV